MRRHLPLITVVACQALLVAIALFLHFVTIPVLAATYRDLGAPISDETRLTMSAWYLPSLAAVAIACDLVALALRRKTARNAALGVGLVVPAFGLALAVHAIFVPLFRLAPAP